MSSYMSIVLVEYLLKNTTQVFLAGRAAEFHVPDASGRHGYDQPDGN